MLNYLCNLCSFDFIVRQREREGAAQSRVVECNLRLLDNLCGFSRGNRVGGRKRAVAEWQLHRLAHKILLTWELFKVPSSEPNDTNSRSPPSHLLCEVFPPLNFSIKIFCKFT